MPTILELLAAGGVGGIITQYVGKGSERRAARAEVRKVLSVVDMARWRKATEGKVDDFGDQVRNLMTAAMVAQVPRGLVERYIYAAQAARAALVERSPVEGELESAGPRYGLDSDVADYLDDTRTLLVDYIWRPWLQRPLLRRRLKALDERREKLRGETGAGRFLGLAYWTP